MRGDRPRDKARHYGNESTLAAHLTGEVLAWRVLIGHDLAERCSGLYLHGETWMTRYGDLPGPNTRTNPLTNELATGVRLALSSLYIESGCPCMTPGGISRHH